MKMTFLKMAHLLLLTLALISCGEDSGNISNEDRGAKQYFSSFVTSMNGKSSGKRLKASGNTLQQVGVSSVNTQRVIILDLDSDGTYTLYLAPDRLTFGNNPTGLTDIDGIVGNWKIEDNQIVLENVGRSPDYRQSNTQVNNNFLGTNTFNQGNLIQTATFSDCNFPIYFENSVTLQPNDLNGGVNSLFINNQTSQIVIQQGDFLNFALEGSTCDQFINVNL